MAQNIGKVEGVDHRANDFVDANHMVHYWDKDEEEEIQQYLLPIEREFFMVPSGRNKNLK